MLPSNFWRRARGSKFGFHLKFQGFSLIFRDITTSLIMLQLLLFRRKIMKFQSNNEHVMKEMKSFQHKKQ